MKQEKLLKNTLLQNELLKKSLSIILPIAIILSLGLGIGLGCFVIVTLGCLITTGFSSLMKLALAEQYFG